MTSPYPQIADYGFLSDCHTCALVSTAGSVDWCCLPRIDSASVFGRLLDWERGGHFRVAPVAAARVTRRYLDGTLVLETTFATDGGVVRLVDCFTMRAEGEHDPHRQLLRVVEGVAGSVAMTVDLRPRLDYGAVKPWVRRAGDALVVIGGDTGLLVSGDVPLALTDRHTVGGGFTLGEGERVRFSLVFRPPEEIDEGKFDLPAAADLDGRLRETVAWWRRWSARGRCTGPHGALVRRSTLVLKGLTNAPTGAIAAAATTSLPEGGAGGRTWDYRFSWIRDSVFTVKALVALGHDGEADGFRRFVERSAAGSADEIQVLYGVSGRRRQPEFEVAGLEGYRGAGPVRVGNAAGVQLQLDVYGEILGLAWLWHRLGRSPDDDYWEFLVETVNAAAARWEEPDRGIWEIRGRPRHFVHSKVMCWAALDKGLRLAGELGRAAPVAQWRRARAAVREAVERRGFDEERGVLVQAFDAPELDAALLLVPSVEFLAYDDPRMVRTVDAIRAELGEGALLRRYRAGSDELAGREGTFLACSFWLAECLARQGRRQEAAEVFREAAARGNDLGLFAEECDAATGEMLGNFPQGLTHLSLVAAAAALADDGTCGGEPPGGDDR